jgi:NRAMP (natural resistance-associated macrophage protein)-like metal ion transporter
MCIAYIDPGNLEADLQTGAQTGYALLWLLLFSTACGFLLQSLSAKLGVATGRHLAQHCRSRYARPLRIMLWLMAETAIIGSDVQEVIGTAVALSLLTGGAMPLWAGVVAAAVSAYLFLFLERLGVRWLEAFFQALVGIMALTFGALFFYADVPYAEVARGFLVPSLPPAALPTAAALIGSILMPHNLFLHSALVHNRAMPASMRSAPLSETLWYYTLESGASLFITLCINTAVISVFAKGFFGASAPGDIGLENAGQYLAGRFGQVMAGVWGVGLLAAGQSSTMTGTYAGQFVMSGYLNIRMKPSHRALLTRAVAVGPTLAVALAARKDSTRLDALNQWLNILQAVQLPFAVIPLLALTSDRAVMGIGFANSRATRAAGWAVATLIIAINCGTAWQLLVGEAAGHCVALRAAIWGAGAAYVGLVTWLIAETFFPVGGTGAQGCLAEEEEEEADIVAPLLLGTARQSSGAREVRPDSARSNLSSHPVQMPVDASMSM